MRKFLECPKCRGRGQVCVIPPREIAIGAHRAGTSVISQLVRCTMCKGKGYCTDTTIKRHAKKDAAQHG